MVTTVILLNYQLTVQTLNKETFQWMKHVYKEEILLLDSNLLYIMI